MRPVTSLAAAALCGLTATPGLASDLKLDGQTSATATLGSSVQIDLTGNPGLVSVVALDVSPGPVAILGETLPIGLTPALQNIAIGATDGTGLYSVTVPVANDPVLGGLTFYLLGAIIDPTDSNGIDFSNGADLTIDGDATEVDLVGVTRAAFPFFDWIITTREGDNLEVAIDPDAFPALVGQTVDIYVVADKKQDQWDADPSLVDLTDSGASAVTIGAGGVPANIFTVDGGSLSGDAGAGLGVPYDVVVDVDGDGQLSAADLIDGYSAAGFFVAADPTVAGPYTVVEQIYSGGTFLGQDLYYPANVAELDNLPLVIVSHGNGHNYQWYDHIGFHLASYGYVVMSHQNNTVPGIETASTTTLTNTDALLGNLDFIAGGVLDGKIDTANITWIGHSRGGEGVCRAYDRIIDGTYTPSNFTADDIVLISSIAPTDFLGTNSATPHDKPYHLWVGAGDSDVSGCPSSNVTQSYHLLGRAENQRQGTTFYGVGHAWFHNGGGTSWFTGPCALNQNLTHGLMRGYLLPLVEYHMRGNLAGKDFLTRQFEDLHPQSTPLTNPCIVVNTQYREGTESGKIVIDDYQSQTDPLVASSGAVITTDLPTYTQGRYDDPDSNFTHSGAETFNGFTYSNTTDPETGAVLGYNSGLDHVLSFDIPAGISDWSGMGDLSFRACQVTRHPNTTLVLEDAVFEVRLVDTDGDSAVIRIDAHGAGIEEPYQRGSCGTGTGWGNEFEQIAIGLRGFTLGGSGVDLDSIDKLEFLFGPSHGSASARFGLDDIEVTPN